MRMGVPLPISNEQAADKFCALTEEANRRLAIANPLTDAYGMLTSHGMWAVPRVGGFP